MHYKPIRVLPSTTILAAFFLAACATAPVQLSTIPQPPSSEKLRIHIETHRAAFTGVVAQVRFGADSDWQKQYPDYAADQRRLIEEHLDEQTNYEIVSSDDVKGVLGNQKPRYNDLEQNDWALAKQIGKALYADYVIIVNRWIDIKNQDCFSATLININTGQRFASSNSESDLRMQVGNEQRMMPAVYKEVFRSAKKDLRKPASRKKDAIAVKVPAAAPVVPVIPVSLPVPARKSDSARFYIDVHRSAFTGKFAQSFYSGIADWQKPYSTYAEDQYQLIEEHLGELTNYEIVGNNDVKAVLGDRKPSHNDLEQNDWALAKQIGKALNADYVMIMNRWIDPTNHDWFSATLININSGQRFTASNSETHIGNQAAYEHRMTAVYKEVFQNAKKDLRTLANKNKNTIAVNGSAAAASIGSLIPAAAPVPVIKPDLAVAKKTTVPPVIRIAAPDVASGASVINTVKMSVSGKATAESGVAEVLVNRKSAVLDEAGNFNTEILLKVGKNLVTVVAMDTDGNKGTKTFTIERQALAKKEADPPKIEIVSPALVRGVKIVNTSKVLISGKASSESGVAEVYVNGENAVLGDGGAFNAELLLKVGENEIIVSAMDTLGNKGTHKFKIERQAQKLARPEDKSLVTGKYYALIIGNNNYKHIAKLQTAQRDAKEVEKVLKEQYGFETRLLIDATRNDIFGAMNYFRKSLNENDNFLIYYAGHGQFDKRADKSYWLPVDAEQDNDTNWIIADDVTTNLKRITSKHVLVVADSCYAGTLTRSINFDLVSKGNRDEYLKKMQERLSRSLIASGGNEPVSDGGGSRHSVFADAFLRALREIDKSFFSAEELFYGYIKERVAGRSEQVPEYNTIKNSGHDGGDFVFTKKQN